MTLNNIFDQVRYGEEYLKQKVIKENIEKCYDKELSLFYASKRAKQLTQGVVFTEGEEQKINRVISKLTTLEGRLETGKLMSEAYRKMQTAAIVEDCKALMDEAQKYRKIDSAKANAIGRILGETKYFITENLDDGVALKSPENPLLAKAMKDEIKDIKNTL